MIADILIRYLHFISIIVLFAALLGQFLLLRSRMTRREILRVQRIDILYAVIVVIVLATGFAQWFWVAKPAEFYSSNPVFHVKITLFLLIGIISAYPSVFLGKNKKGDPEEIVAVPKLVIVSVRIELLLLFMIPLLAILIARGIGIPLPAQ